MAATTRECILEARSTGEASSSGQMEPNTRVNGETTKCMEKGSSVGAMGGFTKVTTIMTRNTVMELTYGRTDANMQVDFITENNMEKAFTSRLMAMKCMGCGSVVRKT